MANAYFWSKKVEPHPFCHTRFWTGGRCAAPPRSTGVSVLHGARDVGGWRICLPSRHVPGPGFHFCWKSRACCFGQKKARKKRWFHHEVQIYIYRWVDIIICWHVGVYIYICVCVCTHEFLRSWLGNPSSWCQPAMDPHDWWPHGGRGASLGCLGWNISWNAAPSLIAWWLIPGLVNIQKAIENGHRNSGFSWIFALKVLIFP